MKLLLLLFFITTLEGKESILKGRNGIPLYRLEIPETWESIETPLSDDTRLPIAAWRFGEIKILFHNFPGMTIPPESQVERWIRQAPADLIQPQAFSGFQGLLYENETTLAWALSWRATPKEEDESFADITFKATGPIEQERDVIFKTVRSFERLEAPILW